MLEENSGAPRALLEKYQKYEYICNVSKSKLKKELFGDGKGDAVEAKAPIEKLREEITRYD